MKKTFLLLISFLLIWILSACQVVVESNNQITTTSLYTNTWNEDNILTPTNSIITHAPSFTASQFITLTPTQSIISGLSSGEYILLNNDNKMMIYSEDGDIMGNINVNILGSASLSANNKIIVFSAGCCFTEPLYLYNINMETLIEIPNSKGCMSPDWMPDEEHIIASCDSEASDSDIHIELFLLSIDGSEKKQITDCLKIHPYKDKMLCGIKHPLISPDGKWLLFDYIDMVSFQPRDMQIRLLETNCLNMPETCIEKSLRFISVGDREEYFTSSWAPDSLLLAMIKPYDENTQSTGIKIYNMINLQMKEYIETSTNSEDDIIDVAWSPSGNNIAYTMLSGLYIYSLSDRTHYKLSNEIGSVLLYLLIR